MPVTSWESSELAIYASLMEFLSSTSWEDGSHRLTGTLQISTGAGRWQGKIRDLDAKRYCFVTAESLSSLLEALDRVCETGQADWRADEWPGKKESKK